MTLAARLAPEQHRLRYSGVPLHQEAELHFNNQGAPEPHAGSVEARRNRKDLHRLCWSWGPKHLLCVVLAPVFVRVHEFVVHVCVCGDGGSCCTWQTRLAILSDWGRCNCYPGNATFSDAMSAPLDASAECAQLLH